MRSARCRWLGLLAVVATACSGGAGAAGPAGPGDAGADVLASGGVDGAPDVGAPDQAPASAPCGSGPACAPDHFCSNDKLCVSAVLGVSAGSAHTCAVHKDGHVSCWGSGEFIAPGLPVVTPPIPIELGGRAKAVVAAIQASCALLEDGSVTCWGKLAAAAEAPAKIVKADGAPLSGVTQIAGGSDVFCALNPAGTWCWGNNAGAGLARPAEMSFPPHTAVLARPGPPPRLIAATVAVVIHDGGTQLCGWGNNNSALVPGAMALDDTPACTDTVPNVYQLTAGDGHVCARRGGATFSCWGQNSGGQLGTGNEDQLDAPIPGVPQTLPADIDTLAAGAYHNCALLVTGAVMCWGNNDFGECGVSSSSALFSAKPVAHLSARAVAIGAGAGAQHTCVVLGDGSVQCWGYDHKGQLGYSATTENDDRFSADPVPVRW